ncbi:ispH [Symbiodinium natans]|uniref:IspH protein n=1 Tax=Symbiodinium natans TaxID=878477 RepID=A0A812URF7_9DINO|nr:ispH [Symbiodinium natans]
MLVTCFARIGSSTLPSFHCTRHLQPMPPSQGPTSPGVARVASAAEVLPQLRTAGACILEGAGTSREEAKALPRRIFGAALAAAPEPAEVSERTLGARGIRKDDSFRAHTDGHAYGDLFPDYFLLLCAHASEQGGGNFIIDGYAVLDGLAEDTDTAWVVEALETRPVDQTSRLPSITPVVLRAPDGRRALRCRLSGPPSAFAAQRVSPDSDDPDQDSRMLAIYHQAVEEAAEAAGRIYLRPGDALIVDNYRMFHGRDPYVDPNRLLWRCWIWTCAARGIPESELHSTPGDTAGRVCSDEAPLKRQRLEEGPDRCS